MIQASTSLVETFRAAKLHNKTINGKNIARRMETVTLGVPGDQIFRKATLIPAGGPPPPV